MIKSLFIFLTVFVLAWLVAAPPIYSQDDSNMRAIEGRVISVDAQNSQIVVKAYESFAFSVPSGAKITNQDGFDVELSKVNPGNYVMIGYYDDRDGHHIIQTMNVEYKR